MAYNNPYKLSPTLPPKPPNLIGFWVHSKLEDNDPDSHWYRFVRAMQLSHYERSIMSPGTTFKIISGLQKYDAIGIMTVNSYRFIEFPTEEAYTRFLLEW